jgi:hypothetical protein
MSLRLSCALAASFVSFAVGCGGSAFVAGSAEADAGDSGAGDAAAQADGAQDAAAPPPMQAIGCGIGAGAPTCDRTCCVTHAASGGGYDFRCEDALTCGAAMGTGLRCNGSGDCKSGQVCCIGKAGTVFGSICAASCGATEGQLCTMPVDPACPATQPCSPDHIDSWGLPSPPYATCGGVQAP